MTDSQNPTLHPFLSWLVAYNHDLRTPLNSIIGFSRVILKGIDGPINDIQSEDLSSIHNGGLDMLAMLNEVIDMAKLETGHIELFPKPLPLRELAEETLERVAPLVGDKPLTLQVEVARDLPPAWADESRTRQVLYNLLSFCARNTQAGTITIRGAAHNDHLLVTVEDTGEGWPQDEVALMLEPYRPPQEVQHIGGVGLSLALARRFAELQGGALAVESRLGQGTTFLLSLPLAAPEDAAS